MAEFKTWKRKKRKKPRPGITCSEAGRMGGDATARATTHKQRVAWGEKGGNTTKTRYGPDYYRQIGALAGEASHQRKLRKPKPRASKDGLFRRLKRKPRLH